MHFYCHEELHQSMRLIEREANQSPEPTRGSSVTLGKIKKLVLFVALSIAAYGEGRVLPENYQTLDGFGFTLTGGSAMHIVRMDAASRDALLQELFASDGANIGVSYLRVSIGASDLNEHVFSYNDLPPGQVDPEMTRFSLDPDRADVIPVLKEILKIAPDTKIMGSPWSPPSPVPR